MPRNTYVTAARLRLAAPLASLCLLLPAMAAAQTPIKVGYWASGLSAGIGYVMEDGKFLEKEGLKPEWVHFTKLAEVNRALVSKSIDLAAGDGPVQAFRLDAEHVPAKVILANTIADANFVVLASSSIKTMADLRGKKIATSPPGSTAYALTEAVLQANYGIATTDYKQVPSGEAQLAVFLQRHDIDAALMRSITYRMLGGQPQLRVLSSLPAEWRKMLKNDSPPILGLSIINADYAKANPKAAEEFVLAIMKATKWGSQHPKEVSDTLVRRLNMKPKEAKAYADSWNDIYFTSLSEADIKSLMVMADLFKTSAHLPGKVSRDLFMTAPYESAKKAMMAAK